MNIPRIETPRQLTEDEVRDNFLKLVASYVRYWENEARVTTVREKLEGLAFGILVILDGGAAMHPGYVVAPHPHPDDKCFNVENGNNYYPESPKVECDIAGGLHEHIHEYLRCI